MINEAKMLPYHYHNKFINSSVPHGNKDTPKHTERQKITLPRLQVDYNDLSDEQADQYKELWGQTICAKVEDNAITFHTPAWPP